MSSDQRTRAFTRARYGALAIVAFAEAALAAPPLDPLPAPLYSFDRDSPTVLDGIVWPGDLLMPGPEFPLVVVPAPALGLLSFDDDLNALSVDRASPIAGETFALLFSVSRATVGTASPDPVLVQFGVPYNVLDQAQRGHAAGDQFMSTELFTFARGDRGLRIANNVQVRNNYDEGGTDFSAKPPTSSSDVSRGVSGVDEVDATGWYDPGRGDPRNVYFCATGESPSLPFLPGGELPSGAHVFYNEAPLGTRTPTLLYAHFLQLGLVQADDIDALLVFDRNENGFYDPPDIVFFSLTPESPSLETIPGASDVGAAADVFVVYPGAPPMLFVPAAALGLGAPGDSLDAMEWAPCADAFGCATQHGIRTLRGDMDCDGDIDFDDIDAFVLALEGQAAYEAQYPNCFWINADCNTDFAVDFDDIDPFVELLAGH